jgi:uncharacterized protein (DUF433 family)
MTAMTGLVGIGDMIESRPDYREGRPYIAGTGVSVGRIGVLLNAGLSAEQMVEDMQGLSLAQVHAALAYYLANREKIDADLQAQDEEYVRAAKAQKAARARDDRSMG